MLKDCGHSGDAEGLISGERGSQRVLRLNGELGFAGGTQRSGGAVLNEDDVNIQTGFLKIALFLGNIKAGMVGVGRPVQGKGDLCQVFGLGAVRIGRGAGCTGGKAEHHK